VDLAARAGTVLGLLGCTCDLSGANRVVAAKGPVLCQLVW
jgi:hypothetical protein